MRRGALILGCLLLAIGALFLRSSQREIGDRFLDVADINQNPPGATSCKDTVIDVLIVANCVGCLKTGADMIKIANEAFEASGLKVKLEGYYRQIEGQTSESVVDDVKHLATGWNGEIYDLRKDTSADVVTLIGNTYTDCGAARQIAATADKAFMVVSKECSTRGRLSFAHELGHLAGAAHNDEPAKVPFEYAHGHVDQGLLWGTIMGVGAAQGGTISRWSDPKASYNGKPLGKKDYADNVRLWRERAAVLAGFVCKVN